MARRSILTPALEERPAGPERVATPAPPERPAAATKPSRLAKLRQPCRNDGSRDQTIQLRFSITAASPTRAGGGCHRARSAGLRRDVGGSSTNYCVFRGEEVLLIDSPSPKHPASPPI